MKTNKHKSTTQHKTTQKSKKMSNMGLTKIQVLAKRKQFLVNYIPDAYKYQTQNRWQALVASMHHMGTCEG
jgi:hypothetical protein